ncbi:hypothetical protein CAPTEDRAFT_203297 [Capitella teleta]|uniref:Reverse transcriptase domain-containing protein n=1 Tax=Capitella teleta TaxID=283909 RepID=R7U161_CAPTE|nr:hypothetical protein CAPTEDRAFT_203297 [Capitella teleta]|eukprot:ELT96925.1 hypothetical protein CAPTEDRAFT_203297 [Capitella teleta]
MAKFGCSEQFTQLVRQLHVTDNGEKSDQFPVTNGVKQGYVLAPTLFSLMFSAMMTDAFRHEKPGLDIRYRTDGGLFNLQRLKAKTKTHVGRVCELLFADDCALNATNTADMQRSVNLFSAACDNFGLTISIKKTEVMHQPAPGQPNQYPCVTVNDLRAERARDCFHLPRGNQRILRGQKANVQLANTGGQKFAENKEPESKRIHHCQIATTWKAPIFCIFY